MKKNSLYIAGICAALSVGALGCASSAKAGDEETKPVVEDTAGSWGDHCSGELILCLWSGFGGYQRFRHDRQSVGNQQCRRDGDHIFTGNADF